MKDATLCLFVKNDEILLAMKKRGFGIGKWNGVGGKIDKEKGDNSIIEAAIRETKEEIGINANNLEKVALLHFRFPYKEDWNQDVHVFLVKNWQGQPQESEEMFPKWFKINEIPYNKMWDDDRVWLPHILEGKKLEAEFLFREGEIIAAPPHIHFVRSI